VTFAIQHCVDCGARQYPPRDVCRRCLSDALELRQTLVTGTVMAQALIHRSFDPDMTRNGALPLGLVALSDGLRLIALLTPQVAVGMTVTLHRHPDRPGAIIAHALLLR
jgi:uncharacterized OB-fold protein